MEHPKLRELMPHFWFTWRSSGDFENELDQNPFAARRCLPALLPRLPTCEPEAAVSC